MRILLCVVLLGSSCLASGEELRRSGFLGVAVAPLTDSAREKLHLPAGVGVLVQNLVDGGTAKAAGVQPNDIITELNGRPTSTTNEFVQVARNLRAGDKAVIRVRRGESDLIKEIEVKPRPQEISPDADVYYRAVSVDGSLRRVIVTVPKTAGKHPAILYVNGIGCFSQESLDLSTPDAQLLYGLTRAGYVTMRVEKSSMGESQGPPCTSPQADLQAEVRGYLAGLKALKQYDFVDAGNVFVLGLSIGGVEAPLLVSQEPVKGVMVMNTVAKPFLDYYLETMRRQKKLKGVASEEAESDLRLLELCNRRVLVDGEAPEQVTADVPACKGHVSFPAPTSYMRQWALLNVAEAWKRVEAPVLILYGTSDFVASNSDHPLLASMLNKVHPGQATLEAIPQMDHYLTQAATMDESISRQPGAATKFQPAVLDAIRGWLAKNI